MKKGVILVGLAIATSGCLAGGEGMLASTVARGFDGTYGTFGGTVAVGVGSWDMSALAPAGEQFAMAPVDGTSYEGAVTMDLTSNVAVGGEVSYLYGSGEFGGSSDLKGTKLSLQEWSTGPFVQFSVPLSEDSKTQLSAFMRVEVIAEWQDTTT